MSLTYIQLGGEKKITVASQPSPTESREGVQMSSQRSPGIPPHQPQEPAGLLARVVTPRREGRFQSVHIRHSEVISQTAKTEVGLKKNNLKTQCGTPIFNYLGF